MDYKQKTFKGDFNNCFLGEFIEPDTYDLIRNLTENEVKDILKANDLIFELVYYERKIAEIYFNYDCLRKTINKYTDLISKMTTLGLDDNTNEVMYVDVNSTFINFIASFVHFVNTIEQKRYGKHPHLKGAFKAVTGSLYDKYFSYKLFYNLRNYALHYFFPIGVFHKSSIMNLDGKGYACKLEIFFDKFGILQGNLQKDLIAELRFYNSTFLVTTELQNFETPLKELIDAFWRLEKNEFDFQSGVLLQFANESKNARRTIVGKVNDNPSATVGNVSTIILPLASVDRIKAKFY